MSEEMRRAYQRYTTEEVAFLKANHEGRTRLELATLFMAKFGREITLKQVKSFVANRGLNSGLTGRFEKGQTPWNQGKTGYIGANATSFKKGNLPHNHRPLWSERVSRDGYVEISVPEPNPYTGYPSRFKHKHVWLWEQANGPKPKGSAVIFRDGNNRNFDLDNLLLVTRAELLALNANDYKSLPDELKPSVLALSRLEVKAGFRTRPGRGRRRNERTVKEGV